MPDTVVDLLLTFFVIGALIWAIAARSRRNDPESPESKMY